MSNAMRTGKRTLAGVAAGALAAGLIPFAVLASAGAANAATGTATVSPLRVTFTGTVKDAVPDARASFKLSIDDSNSVALTIAPAGATLTAGAKAVTLAAAATDVPVVRPGSADAYVAFSANVAGRYAGTIGDGTDTASFDFTTTGVPTSMTLTPATQTVLVGAPATVTATLRDAAGNVTQPATTDSVALAVNPTTDSVSPTTIDAAALFSGVAQAAVTTAAPAGSTTITATPLGTLPNSGVTAQTATVVKSGTVSANAVKTVVVTAPANALPTPANTTAAADRTVDVPQGTSTIAVQIDDTTANAPGTTVRWKAFVSAGTVNGVAATSTTPVYVNTVTDANRQIKPTFTLGGAALLPGAKFTLKQVDVTNANVGSGNGLVVTQEAPVVSDTSIKVTPDDSNIAALGATTPVQVTVADQFGAPQAGWTVNAFRGATVSGDFLSAGTTSAAGVADLTVTNATTAVDGTVEQYSFQAVPPVGTAVAVNNKLQITYSTTGTITTLSVVADPVSNPGTITNATTNVITAPALTVPFDGVANTKSTDTFAVATGAVTGTQGGEVAEFTVTPSTATAVTAQVPLGSSGIFVSDTPTTAWDAGKTSVTVASGGKVYVFGIKAQTTSINFTAGGKSVSVPVKVSTAANAAYNVAITPETQNVMRGGIGTATLTVTDVFGNPVNNTALTPTDSVGGAASATDMGAVQIGASGEILLAGFQTSSIVVPGADGTATITFIAGNANGEGNLTATVPTGSVTPAWQANYTPPTNAPAPVTSAAATVRVGDGPVEQSIIIEGVRSNRSIEVEGLTQGLAEGTIVRPWIKFPGQTSYSQGVAQRSVIIFNADDELGQFAWQRRTGKKTYVYFKTEDGGTQSLRVIIPAR